jgi:uncharacterized membrane protein
MALPIEPIRPYTYNLGNIISSGRLIFAIAISALGAEHLVWAAIGDPNNPAIRDFKYTPIIPFVPDNSILMCVTGLALLLAGLSIAANLRPRISAVFLGVFFLACVLFLEVPRGIMVPMDISTRTAFFETLALGAIALTLAGLLPSDSRDIFGTAAWVDGLIKTGPSLFAISSIVFGIDHFLILDFIAKLVPSWIPAPLLWANLTGAGFVATGICILVRKLDYWAPVWLGIMFLLWVLVLHGPRVVSYPKSHSPAEWSSAFIAMAMWGGSWIHALDARRRHSSSEVVSFARAFSPSS